jgi:hypothetical protein
MSIACSVGVHIHAELSAAAIFYEILVGRCRVAASKAHAWIISAAAGKPKERRISKFRKRLRERLGNAELRKKPRMFVWEDGKDLEERACEICDIEMGGNGGRGREGGPSGGKIK